MKINENPWKSIKIHADWWFSSRVFITTRVLVTGDPNEKCHGMHETCATPLEISGKRIAKQKIKFKNFSGNIFIFQISKISKFRKFTTLLRFATPGSSQPEAQGEAWSQRRDNVCVAIEHNGVGFRGLFNTCFSMICVRILCLMIFKKRNPGNQRSHCVGPERIQRRDGTIESPPSRLSK